MDSSRSPIILSTAYFPPVQYFTFFIGGCDIIVERYENYTKQTYRNRCRIYSPNGIQILSVPVERGSFHKVNISELRIAYSRSWQQNHLRALNTAYGSSAFYEFYIDIFAESVLKKHKFLIDMNMEILHKLMSALGLDNSVKSSDKYIADVSVMTDLRESLTPKNEDRDFISDIPEYFQVFSIDRGFIPNLSILDLIFNMGPESYSYLLSCTK